VSLLVVDASAILRALLPGQDPEGAVSGTIAMLLAAGAELIAPDILVYEMGRAASRFRADAMNQQAVVPRGLQLVRLVRPGPDVLAAALATAVEEGLSFYDAAYVALARSEGTSLWTEDVAILQTCADVAVDTATLARRHR
jgi:predicted nucleic acid-binding protein